MAFILILPSTVFSNPLYMEIDNGDTTYSDTLPDGYKIVDSVYLGSMSVTSALSSEEPIELELTSNCSVYIKMEDENGFNFIDSNNSRQFNIALNNNILYESGTGGFNEYDTSLINIRPGYILKIENTGSQVIESATFAISRKQYIIEPINTSIFDRKEDVSVKLYPNPVINELWVDFGEYVNNIEYQIFNTSGKLVNHGYTQNRIDMSNLNKGMYIVTLNYNGDLIQEKVVRR